MENVTQNPSIKNSASVAVEPTVSDPAAAPVRILRLSEVIHRVGLCRASIYQHMSTGYFPPNIAIGPRSVGWLEHEVDAWLAMRIKSRSYVRRR